MKASYLVVFSLVCALLLPACTDRRHQAEVEKRMQQMERSISTLQQQFEKFKANPPAPADPRMIPEAECTLFKASRLDKLGMEKIELYNSTACNEGDYDRSTEEFLKSYLKVLASEESTPVPMQVVSQAEVCCRIQEPKVEFRDGLCVVEPSYTQKCRQKEQAIDMKYLLASAAAGVRQYSDYFGDVDGEVEYLLRYFLGDDFTEGKKTALFFLRKINNDSQSTQRLGFWAIRVANVSLMIDGRLKEPTVRMLKHIYESASTLNVEAFYSAIEKEDELREAGKWGYNETQSMLARRANDLDDDGFVVRAQFWAYQAIKTFSPREARALKTGMQSKLQSSKKVNNSWYLSQL